MKHFSVDKDLEDLLVRIGKTFGHKDIYDTVFSGFMFLRFLEEIQNEEKTLYLEDKEGKVIKLPIADLLKIKPEEEEENKSETKKSKKNKKVIR